MNLFDEIPPIKKVEVPIPPPKRRGEEVALTEGQPLKKTLPKVVPYGGAEAAKAARGFSVLRQREALAALLAEGVNLPQAAVLVGMEEGLAKELTLSHLFKRRVEQIKERIEAQVTDFTASPVEILEGEANRTIKTLTELRDTAGSESVRLTAASKLLDSTPSLRKQALMDDIFKIVVTSELAERLSQVIREVKALPKPIEGEIINERDS